MKIHALAVVLALASTTFAAAPAAHHKGKKMVESRRHITKSGGHLIFYRHRSSKHPAKGGHAKGQAPKKKKTPAMKHGAAKSNKAAKKGSSKSKTPSKTKPHKRNAGIGDDLQKRWGSSPAKPCTTSANAGNLRCSNDSYGARNDICDALVTELYGDSSIIIKDKDQQVCYQSNGLCCVSWSKATTGVTKGGIADYASRALSECTVQGVSALFMGVKLGTASECMNICVSNRGTGCE